MVLFWYDLLAGRLLAGGRRLAHGLAPSLSRSLSSFYKKLPKFGFLVVRVTLGLCRFTGRQNAPPAPWYGLCCPWFLAGFNC